MSQHQHDMERLTTLLRELRGSIDEIDSIEFGKLEKHFDKLALEADRAIDLADSLEVSIDWDAEASV